MFKISAALVVATIAAGVFASNAEARGGTNFLVSPFFRNQGIKPTPGYVGGSAHHDSDVDDAIAARARARRLEAARAAEAAAAAREAAAARRARLIAAERREAAKNAAVANVTSVPETTTATNSAPALKKSDQLPTAVAVTTEKTNATSDTATQAAPETCRKYSAATAGLVDTPCQ